MELRTRAAPPQMPRLEVLHQVPSLLRARLGDPARDEVRDDVPRLDDGEDQLRDLADC